ncbi:YgaP-like transmembrane domain [Acidithrix sp. C25]|uniref:YgaP-like transmembrane domain n=1 Tax=Acidithrix sp. C25 TaxID=1671482 RepID=UPI00191B944A|nr:YgaP-like transmembrane domain [Acidithrix sp. C25]CAG4924640.1 unnamed protein product [Acidithrix sp. C25]
MKFITFMNSTTGRSSRIIAGLILIFAGLIPGKAWIVISIVGLVPFVAGIANKCILTPLTHNTPSNR